MTVETTKRRGPIEAEIRPPAPIYWRKTTVGVNDHCQTYPQSAAYSIGLKRRGIKDTTPGPGYSFDAHLTRQGRKEDPSYSLSGRHPMKSPYITPAPGAYNTHTAKEGATSRERRPASITISQRTNWPFKNDAPPPNAYMVKTGIGANATNEKHTPSYSLRPRSLVGGSQYSAIKANNPGPGSYGSVEPNVFKKSSGVFTLQGRTAVKNYNTVMQNPGPGSYDPNLPRSGRRGCSLGVRHSEYTMPFISDVDII